MTTERKQFSLCQFIKNAIRSTYMFQTVQINPWENVILKIDRNSRSSKIPFANLRIKSVTEKSNKSSSWTQNWGQIKIRTFSPFTCCLTLMSTGYDVTMAVMTSRWVWRDIRVSYHRVLWWIWIKFGDERKFNLAVGLWNFKKIKNTVEKSSFSLYYFRDEWKSV